MLVAKDKTDHAGHDEVLRRGRIINGISREEISEKQVKEIDLVQKPANARCFCSPVNWPKKIDSSISPFS
ncbi:hypothetical protein YTPLAS72_18260 [Nitrospira sp.]|nr:hypothetical protein YTPLAS72_18260 [Nitrospira sp.]